MNPLLETSEFAPDRDLLGEITKAARADGLYVVSRMASGVLNPKIHATYPQWLTRRSGRRAPPFRRDSRRRLPTQSYMRCATFSLYICLSADKITHIWRGDALFDRSRMHKCQGFEPL